LDSGDGVSGDAQARLLQAELPAAGSVAGPNAYDVAIAAEFIRRMDGDLWCESEPRKGACFSFRLPAIEEG
jgi:K+-sensing histidine kinase KdpD